MQPIFVVFFMILLFVTWTLERDIELKNITRTLQNEENNQTNVRINQVKYKEEYEKALRMSFLFFEAQRSGKLSPHNRIAWRSDSLLDDHTVFGENLSGGYFHSGLSYVKYVFPTAFTTTMLAWGVLTWPGVYRDAGQTRAVRETIKWATDYFMKCHTQNEIFYVQVGNEYAELKFIGRPEELSYRRPAHAANSSYPASDILGETAAALAAAAIVFRDIFHEESYSDKCLTHAKTLYAFASAYKGSHYNWIPDNYNYEINRYMYGDDLTWAALWIYKATKDSIYLREASEFYKTYNLRTKDAIFNYYNKVPGVEIMFAQLTEESKHRNAVRTYLDTVINNVTRTKKGLVFLSNNDTLSLAANAAFLCLIAVSSNMEGSKLCYAFAKQQIDYILGINTEKSYVVGFEWNSPTHIRHKASLCPKLPANCRFNVMYFDQPNEQILYGALVNGPDMHDDFIDTRRIDTFKKVYTKVRIDYNAGFTGALAGLLLIQENIVPVTSSQENTEISSYDSLLESQNTTFMGLLIKILFPLVMFG